jgi:hypothetical protein
MREPREGGGTWKWRVDPGVAIEVLRRHRAAISMYGPVTPLDTGDDVGGEAEEHAGADASPAATLTRSDLPPALLELVERWEAEMPGVHLVPLRLVRFDSSAEGLVRGNPQTALPPDDELVGLTVTETVVSADEVDVSGFVLLAQRSSKATS